MISAFNAIWLLIFVNWLVTVVEKLASSPKAWANSFNVSKAPGAESIKSEIWVSTYVSVAYVADCGNHDEFVWSHAKNCPSDALYELPISNASLIP